MEYATDEKSHDDELNHIRFMNVYKPEVGTS